MGIISAIGSVIFLGSLGMGVVGLGIFSFSRYGIHGVINLLLMMMSLPFYYFIASHCMNILTNYINGLHSNSSISIVSDLFSKSMIFCIVVMLILLVLIGINTMIMHIRYDNTGKEEKESE